ncbi:MAG: SH3 domain-containing protein [Chloroflexota bacterium]|nr:SH3 domain-containing protein [Chloroflexota bacterium]MDE2907782.1 SH3 domain-containing protein [Chloroflexota bacterium]
MPKCFKIIIWIALTAILCLTANAQSFSIRVRYNTNIRVQPSLDAAPLESVPAGTVLNVISEIDRWFKVDRSGEAWMASWVSHERVAAPAAQPAATSVNIDNCCNVDRHCQSDHEWEAGYWAFQNGQCSAPASGGYHAPVSIPAGADNCCETGWSCNREHEWVYGHWAFQHNRCFPTPNSLPPQSFGPYNDHGHIRIVELTPGFRGMFNTAFELLRTHAPQWYNYVNNVITEVQERHCCGAGVYSTSGVIVFHHEPHSVRPYIRRDDYTVAETLVHEACHVYQDREGRALDGELAWFNEYECELYAWDSARLMGGPTAPSANPNNARFMNDPMNRALWWWNP